MSPRFLGGRDYHDTSKSKNNVKYDIHSYNNIKFSISNSQFPMNDTIKTMPQ